MGASCCGHDHCEQNIPRRKDHAYRGVLWAALTINVVMFTVEILAGLTAGSASLQADALDFFGDAANYGVSLFVVGLALRYRAMAAFAKGATMGTFGGRNEAAIGKLYAVCANLSRFRFHPYIDSEAIQ